MKYTFTYFLILWSLATQSQYKPTNLGSTIEFKVKNFGFEVKGSLSKIQGTLNFENKIPISFDVIVNVNTINTGIGMRDRHLKGEEYFNAQQYPFIHFISTKINESVKKGTYIVSGILTIKNKSQNISFPFSVLPVEEGFVLNGNFKINRKDFGIGNSGVISNSVEVMLNIQAKKSNE